MANWPPADSRGSPAGRCCRPAPDGTAPWPPAAAAIVTWWSSRPWPLPAAASQSVAGPRAARPQPDRRWIELAPTAASDHAPGPAAPALGTAEVLALLQLPSTPPARGTPNPRTGRPYKVLSFEDQAFGAGTAPETNPRPAESAPVGQRSDFALRQGPEHFSGTGVVTATAAAAVAAVVATIPAADRGRSSTRPTAAGRSHRPGRRPAPIHQFADPPWVGWTRTGPM